MDRPIADIQHEINALSSLLLALQQEDPQREEVINEYRAHIVQLRALVPPSDDINVALVECGVDKRATIMMKNIPTWCEWATLKQFIDQYCVGFYSHLYLPWDRETNHNKGYAFIYLDDPRYIRFFMECFHDQRWPEDFRSNRVIELCYARMQEVPKHA